MIDELFQQYYYETVEFGVVWYTKLNIQLYGSYSDTDRKIMTKIWIIIVGKSNSRMATGVGRDKFI